MPRWPTICFLSGLLLTVVTADGAFAEEDFLEGFDDFEIDASEEVVESKRWGGPYPWPCRCAFESSREPARRCFRRRAAEPARREVC